MYKLQYLQDTIVTLPWILGTCTSKHGIDYLWLYLCDVSHCGGERSLAISCKFSVCCRGMPIVSHTLCCMHACSVDCQKHCWHTSVHKQNHAVHTLLVIISEIPLLVALIHAPVYPFWVLHTRHLFLLPVVPSAIFFWQCIARSWLITLPRWQIASYIVFKPMQAAATRTLLTSS